MKKNIDQNLKDEIEEIINKNIPLIQYHAKLIGIKEEPNWEKYVSEEYYKTLTQDIPVSINNNLINFSSLNISTKFSHIVSKLYPMYQVIASGYYYYPPTGYMSWHTNNNFPCKRVYLTFTNSDNMSFFRYIYNGECITDYDTGGLTVREFDIDINNPLWHCVGSRCDRYSFGFRLL